MPKSGLSYRYQGFYLAAQVGTDLFGADLSGTNLSRANLSGTDLTDADLSSAKGWTNEQLAQARSVVGAILPDGTKMTEEAWGEFKKRYG